MPAGNDADRIASLAREGRKYRAFDPGTVRRISAELAGRYAKEADAVKAVRSALHAFNASFLTEYSHTQALSALAGLVPGAPGNDRTLALSLMGLHASTRERLAEAGDIYAFIGRHIGRDSAVLDIGCGFNPFSIPLLQERPGSYLALEIRADTVALLNEYFRLTGWEGYRAALFDAAGKTPAGHFDTALLLKLFPLLERQREGRAFELLEELDFGLALVSFSSRSLSGRRKGMEQFHSAAFEAGLPGTLRIVAKAAFRNEFFYVLTKAAPVGASEGDK